MVHRVEGPVGVGKSADAADRKVRDIGFVTESGPRDAA